MYPIDLVKYTNTKKKIPAALLSTSAQIYPDSHKGIFKSYLQDGVAVLWSANILGQLMLVQFSAFIIGPMQFKMLSKLPIYAQTSMMFAPLLGCFYYAFSYHLNHGQTFGLFRNKKKVEFENSNWKSLTRYSVFSSFVGSLFGLPLLSKKFVQWSEKNIGFKFRPHDDLYHELFIPKNEWAPSLVEMTLPEIPVMETQEEDYDYIKAA